MNIMDSLPAKDAFEMPGEFEKHHGCIMIWPERPGSWIYGGAAAKKVFTKLAAEIGKREKMYMLASKKAFEEAKNMLPSYVTVVCMESDDAWARDTGPTFVKDAKGNVRGINWSFNAWGGSFDGLYKNWEKDDKIALNICDYLGLDAYNAAPFVLEGGSVHSDGDGTLLVTEACLLSRGRNPELSKAEIEKKLKDYLGAKKVIWLPHGIYNDETNEHVDNVCAFVKPGKVLLAWTDDENDPQYKMSLEDLNVLEKETDAKGRKIEVIKLPVPKKPVCITKEELEGFEFEEGEDEREAGERLAASYVNFYIANGTVLLPQFNDENDLSAVKILKEAFPERKIIPVYARDIIVGGGNIHCITQQIPEF